MAKKENQVIKQIRMDLASKDETTILKALKKVRSKGNDTLVAPLLHTFETSGSDSVQREITGILSELKTTQAIEPLIEGLNSKSEPVRKLALTAIWSSGLDAYDHLEPIVERAIKGSYMEAFEVLTILENFEGPFTEEPVMNARLLFTEQIDVSEEKKDILRSIAKILQDIDNSLQ